MGDGMSGKLVVVFDGKCGFCQSSVAWLQRFDRNGTHLTYVPYQDEALLQREAPEADPRRADTEMLLRAPDGSVHGGFFAVRQLCRVLPLLWWALPFVYFPVLSTWMGPPIYRLIARNRRRIMGTTDVCHVPARR